MLISHSQIMYIIYSHFNSAKVKWVKGGCGLWMWRSFWKKIYFCIKFLKAFRQVLKIGFVNIFCKKFLTWIIDKIIIFLRFELILYFLFNLRENLGGFWDFLFKKIQKVGFDPQNPFRNKPLPKKINFVKLFCKK